MRPGYWPAVGGPIQGNAEESQRERARPMKRPRVPAREESRETAATQGLALLDRLATILKGVPGYAGETPTEEVNQALRDPFQEVVVATGRSFNLPFA